MTRAHSPVPSRRHPTRTSTRESRRSIFQWQWAERLVHRHRMTEVETPMTSWPTPTMTIARVSTTNRVWPTSSPKVRAWRVCSRISSSSSQSRNCSTSAQFARSTLETSCLSRATTCSRVKRARCRVSHVRCVTWRSRTRFRSSTASCARIRRRACCFSRAATWTRASCAARTSESVASAMRSCALTCLSSSCAASRCPKRWAWWTMAPRIRSTLLTTLTSTWSGCSCSTRVCASKRCARCVWRK